jgi:hypothetical protein
MNIFEISCQPFLVTAGKSKRQRHRCFEANDCRGGTDEPTAAVLRRVERRRRAVLTRLAAQKTEKLDWRVVDLMRILDLDSSFSARKQSATGEMDNFGSELAENGGKVPDDLKT